ncbi:GPR1/FUN34/YaaH family transporter [Candidatus Saccharibacteria bacterium]|nr:GPR1/FUN34/YaaH family transporter [Candidatus Saccharibacteria bacterium]
MARSNHQSQAASRIRHQDFTRIVLRPIASGVPLGFFSFAIGMLMLGFSAVGIIPLNELKQTGLILTLFVFPLELISTIFAFLARDSMSAATLGLFTTSWLATGVVDMTSEPGSTSIAVGVYFFGFAAAVCLIAIMAWVAKPFFTFLLGIAFARVLLSGIYEVGGSHGFYTISGYFALALAAVAFYGGVAFTLEDAKQKPVLPLFRRGAANEAFSGYEQQLERLKAEPGIRQQL